MKAKKFYNFKQVELKLKFFFKIKFFCAKFDSPENTHLNFK